MDREPDPVPPEVARKVFGSRFGLAVDYAGFLVTDGVLRGLLGPREAPRIWDRHLLNCAVVVELIPTGASIIDVGSGAGLPGLVLAIARPDLQVTLVEPLARRAAFLTEMTERLGLDNVTVHRARAEECAPRPGRRSVLVPADVVTARAVAPLDRLSSWCLPLAAPGGRMLAMKGESVAEEIQAHLGAIRRAGGSVPVVRLCGAAVIEPPATVVEVTRTR